MVTKTLSITAASFVKVFTRSAARIANSRRHLSNGPQATQKGIQDLTGWREIAWKGLEREESASALRCAIVSLPIKYREVLFLRDVKNLDTGETAWDLELDGGSRASSVVEGEDAGLRDTSDFSLCPSQRKTLCQY
jgi:hypothetical protein